MHSLKYVKCNSCGKDEPYMITTQNDYKVVKCMNCGLVYVNHRPDQKTLNLLYNDYHKRGEKDELAWSRLMWMNFEKVSSFLNRKFPEKGKILDIGCGYGHFIELMRDYGWSVQGIEPSSKTIDCAKKKGLNVIETTIDDASFSDSLFDAVTMFYVLEHLSDPFSALKKIFRMLKPDGVLVIRVPHTTPIVKLLSIFKIKNNLYDPPFHLYDFSPKTIRQMLKGTEFCSIKVIPGEPTSPPSFWQSVISVSSGYTAKLLYNISGGTFLIPGISKTIIAMKPTNSTSR